MTSKMIVRFLLENVSALITFYFYFCFIVFIIYKRIILVFSPYVFCLLYEFFGSFFNSSYAVWAALLLRYMIVPSLLKNISALITFYFYLGQMDEILPCVDL